MKIQCDVCEKAPAAVICCADEAALCVNCDVEIHAANKLASKHQRLLLECLSKNLPRCDICQRERVRYWRKRYCRGRRRSIEELGMKIQCDVCEKASTVLICCANEAVLCMNCEVEIHAANKHQRLLLECLSKKLLRCDICQVISSTGTLP